MSVLGKKWKIQNNDPQMDIVQKLQKNRNFDPQQELQTLHDPFLFTDMQKALDRIHQAIADDQRIMIFGDYDVDGITSTAILFHALTHLKAKVSYRLPHRVKDGYGLSEKFIDHFIEKDIKLIITVDCGISSFQEITKAKQNGIDTIITDHHSIPDNPPPAYAILHPKHCQNYPFKHLTGAGVALKLAQALCPNLSPDYFLQLACMGTVADLGPLTGENRLIVKKGLHALTHTRSAGLHRLKSLAKLDRNQNITSTHIGYTLGPRINAAGRIGNPYKALKLLLEQQCHQTSKSLAQELEVLNHSRRQMTMDAMIDILSIVDQKNPPSIIIEKNPHWHVGILGLIAGRIAEKTNRPAIIMQDLGDRLVASARGPEYFDIISAIRQFDDLLITSGGHPQAAGLSIKKENYSSFKKAITNYCQSKLKGTKPKATINIDCQVNLSELNQQLMDKISHLGPFGIGHQMPTFCLKNVSATSVSQVGAQKNHLKFSLGQLNSIAFNMGQFADKIRANRSLDIVLQLSQNYWNGRKSLQLQILDFRIHQG